MTITAVQLQPPEPFDFRNPTQWSRWKRRFEQYRVASGLATTFQLRQVTTMLYCLGDEANDILATTDITEDEKVIYYRDPTSCFPIGTHLASKYGHHRRQKRSTLLS